MATPPATAVDESPRPPEAEVAFPQHPRLSTDPSDQAGIKDTLVLVDGCLRVGRYLAIWPSDYSLEISGREVRIVHASGQEVARVGDEVRGQGGYIDTALPGIETDFKGLPDRCQGPYVVVGSLSARQ